MKQEEEKKNMQHRFLPFENAEVTKRTGLLPGKPDFKPGPLQYAQTFDLKRPTLTNLRLFNTNQSTNCYLWFYDFSPPKISLPDFLPLDISPLDISPLVPFAGRTFRR